MADRTWLDEVRERVEGQLDRTLRVSDLAKEAGVHRVHLGRAFQERFGESIGDCHRRLRVERAARELADGTKSVSLVAQRCGFADQAHFTRVFKRVMGQTPSQYRVKGEG